MALDTDMSARDAAVIADNVLHNTRRNLIRGIALALVAGKEGLSEDFRAALACLPESPIDKRVAELEQ